MFTQQQLEEMARSEVMSTISRIKTEEDMTTTVQMLMETKYEPVETSIDDLIHRRTIEDIASVKVKCQINIHLSTRKPLF